MNKIIKEFKVFQEQEHDTRTLLMTNMLYALVLPVVEIFVGAYVMRNTRDPVSVAFYQLFMYIGVIITSFINGYLLRFVNIKILYAAGILVSGLSMFVMMMVHSLGLFQLGFAGFILGAASGFFWTNRYLLTLNNTTDGNRNYFFGIESFFFSIAYIIVPLIIGIFLSEINGKVIFGIVIRINLAYRIVTIAVILLTIFTCFVLWKGNFKNPVQKDFLAFRFKKLWNMMLLLASLKGMVQGFLVTAPAILVLKLVGNEGSLGVIQCVSGAITAVLVYVLGRLAKPEDRSKIFIASLVIFFVGALCNGILFSATGVILFVLGKVIFQPLFDLAYFPIMMQTIDGVIKVEKRNEYTYILSHEFGLFLGRAFGLLVFMAIDYWISEVFALKYVLILVAVLQLLAYPLAKNIIKRTQKLNSNV